MKKRILGVLIAVVILILMLPTAVFAADSHTHCICGATHVSVGNHNAAVSTTFTAVKNQTELQNAATNGGNVYLANNITIDSTINVTGNLTLCLNGYTLKNTATNMRVININSGTLNLTDCRSSGTITGGSFNSDGGGVYNNATFNMYGGVISNNTANRGGGVYNNHTFTMYGGVISQNTANNGGGVYNSYSFTMTGGSIINNTANSSPSGGIYLNQYLTLSGKPVISQNKYGSSDGDFDIYKNYTAIKVTEDFAPTGSPIKVSVNSSYNDRVFLEVTGSSADVENYIGYFENISEFPLYKNKNDGKYYAGFAIVENPTSENDYTVKVSSNNDLSCQWYKKISGIKVLTDSDVALWYGEYDTSSQSFTVSSPGLMGEILLNAGDQLIVSSQFEIDAELDGMDFPTVEQDGNTYTFTVPSTDYYLLRVIGNSGESVKLTKNGSDFVEVEGQTALTLDKVNLEVDDYKCKLVWNRGTDDSYDDIEAWSEVVTYTKPIYTITWNVDGNITTEQYEYGATPSFKGSTGKAETPEYTYTFAGWSPAIATVTGDATYTAKFNSTVKKYTITWNVDGNITTEQYEYGATPSFNGSTDKAADAQYTYTFAGWNTEISEVTGNATYTATYNNTVNKYTVTWNVDGAITSEEYEYGATPNFKGSTDKAADAQYTYTFVGWDSSISSVTGNATYTATYNNTVNKYTVTWNVDGAITSEEYEYGATPSFKGSTAKAADSQYTYTFAGWNTEISEVTGNATYTATYNSTANSYAVSLNAGGGTINSGNVTSYTYGVGAALPTDLTKIGYTFVGWYENEDFSGSAVAVIGADETGNKTFFAKWNANSYTVNFNANGGNVDTTSTTVTYDGTYGSLPTPTRTGYSFTGWFTDSENGNQVEIDTTVHITDTQTLYAHWVKTDYNVTVGENANGSVNIIPQVTTMDNTVNVTITPDTGWEVDTVTADGIEITKINDNQYSFIMPAQDVTVNVTYKKIVYTISYGHENGTATGGNYSVDVTAANMGDVVTVTVAKNLGYLIESVTVSTGEAVTDNGDGTYSFVMTASNVVVVVNFDIDVEYHLQTLIDSISEAVLELENAIESDASATVIAEKMEVLRVAISNGRDAIEDYEGVDTDELESEIIAAQATLQTAADKLNTPPSHEEDPDGDAGEENPESNDKETSDGDKEDADSEKNDGTKGMKKTVIIAVVAGAIAIITLIVIIKSKFF